MNTRHKWADVAIAFAEGKVIQRQHHETKEWMDWSAKGFPSFYETDNWRIKPAEPVVRWQWICKDSFSGRWFRTGVLLTDAEADKYFEMAGSVTRFKDEESRVEFPAEYV